MLDELRESHRFTSARKGQPQNWYTFSSGNSSFVYGHSFAAGNRVRTEVYIDSGDADQNKEYFDRLFKNREVIESEFGSPLEWERLDNKRASRIALYREGSIDASSEDVQEIQGWAIQKLLEFKRVFGNRSEWRDKEPEAHQDGGINSVSLRSTP